MRKYRQSPFPDQLPTLTDLGTVGDQGFKLCLSVLANFYAMLQVLGSFIKPDTKSQNCVAVTCMKLFCGESNCSDNTNTSISVKESGLGK